MAAKKETKTKAKVVKKTTGTKKAVPVKPKPKAETIRVTIHLPGALPKKMTEPVGAKVSDVIEGFNAIGYTIYLNGHLAVKDTVLSDGDTLRLGMKVKDGGK